MTVPRFIYNDLGLTATLTSSTEDTDFPKENVQHEHRTKIWKSTDLTSEYLTFDLGTAKTVDAVAIMNSNFNDFTTTTPTVQFQGNATNSWGAPSVDESLTINAGTIIKYIAGGSYRWWRLSMTGGVGTETVYEVGRTFFGARFTPSKSFQIDYQRALVDFTTKSRSIGGQTHMDYKDVYETIGLNFAHISTTDRDNFITMFENNRTAKNLVMTIDPIGALVGSTYYGKFMSLPSFTNTLKTSGDERYSFSLNFEESL